MTGCRYSIAWVGRCGKPVETGAEFCKKHAVEKCCSCQKQATHECDHTAQFVCGFPLCDDCMGVQDHSAPYGLFGFGGHSHRPKEKP